MPRITPDMLISEVLARYPDAAQVFEDHGLACPGCMAAGMESVAAVASVHDVSVEKLVSALNELRSVERSV